MTQTVGNSSLETANQLLQQGKIQEAVAEYRRGIELTPDLSWHHYYLGEALTQLEDWEGAAQAYRQAISLGSNYLCYYRLGVALVKLELWDEAIATLNQGLELKPDYYKFYLPLGQALVHQQHGEAAIEAYGKAVALKPGVAEFNLQLGHLLRRQGRFTEAVGYLQQAADFQGDDPQLQLGLGVALVEAGTDLHRAEASLRRTLELQPDQGEAYFYLGKLEGLRGRWDEALAMYRRSWEINPQVGEWGLALAEALEKLGRWSEAVDQYRQVVLELGESGEASLGLGRALVQLERPVEAVVELRRAVKLGVDRPEVHRLWAGVLVELGRWPDVVEQWKWLLDRYPGAADMRRRLALALMGLGRWPEAAAQWGEYWRVAPGSGRGSVMDFRRELGTYGEIDHRQELSITGDLTVEFWLYLRRWPEGWTEIISKFVSDEQNEFCFRLKDGQRAQWYFGKGEAFAKPVDWVPREDMRLHEWVHVACVRKVGEYGRIYFDGVLRREADWSGEPEAVGTEATVRLMAHSDGKRFNDGKLSEVRIWNRARSADEIREGMYEALTGDEPGLVGVWHGSDDGVLVDAVGHHQGRSVMADGGKERLRVGVCGWELSHNAAGRAYTLAQLYGGWAEVELIGCLFPRYGGQVWEPIRGAEIPCHTVTVADEGRFVEQALGLVFAHPYEVVHLSKPRIPNIVLGLLYKLVWGARVIVDIDDEELAFVKTSEPVNWRELPPLRDLDSQEWTEIAAGLAQEFDKVRELDGAEAGDAEAGELLAAVVAEVLAVPGGGVSQGLDLLLQGLPAVESVKSVLINNEDTNSRPKLVQKNSWSYQHSYDWYLKSIQNDPDNLQNYYKALEIKYDDAELYYGIAGVFDRTSRPELALAFYQMAVEIDADNPHYYLKIGNYFENRNDWDMAIKFYRQSLKINPQLGIAQRKLDNALIKQQSFIKDPTLLADNLQRQESCNFPERNQADKTETKIHHNVFDLKISSKPSSVKITFATIVLNEAEFIENNLKQHYNFCDSWIIVEGACRGYPTNRVTKDGFSTDDTASIIQNFPDPESKIRFIQHGWTNSTGEDAKSELRNRYADLAEDGILVVIDADEFYRYDDLHKILKILAKKRYNCYRLPQLHLWKGTNQIIIGGYWDIGHNRIYSWQSGLKYRSNHNHPETELGKLWHEAGEYIRSGRKLVQVDGGYVHPDPCCFHFGFAKSEVNMRDKTDYYIGRGEDVTRPKTTACREAWFTNIVPEDCQLLSWKGALPEVFYNN
ncbi:tetratricopeptide repeat protein [Limnospira platensis CENA597]|uniref:tetratricopeptide repeat protein n=1 Tax=Limnospira platensis TaxID=118562 RepID=UPI003D9FBB5C